MELIINGSSSKGNQYLLKSKDGILAIEAGIPLQELKKSIDFDISNVCGCIISHEHGDHAKYARDYAKAGIDIYTSAGTLDALKFSSWGHIHRTHVVYDLQYFMVGTFKVMPFKVRHDAAEPFGYLIQHEEMGLCLFLTDTWYCPYKFEGLNQLIIEANYDQEILENNIYNGAVHQSVAFRVNESHMSIATLETMLLANNLTQVNNIILIHLSSANSNAQQFKDRVTNLTGKNVSVAEKGMIINFDKRPF